jgi:pimeloyl-ACP methyl ester carboxylesterase
MASRDEDPGPGFLRWRSWGAADRRALLLHGSGSSSATWWRVAEGLAEDGWRVKAPDLPSHGASPRAVVAMTPRVAAGWIASELADRPLDLVVGYGFGAAVALELANNGPEIGRLVLDGFPDPSHDWTAEADALVERAATARRDPAAALQRLKRDHPGWHDGDCQHAVRDLASLRTAEVSDGIRLGATWPQLSSLTEDRPVLILESLGPGMVRHRDEPNAWVRAILEFAA